MTVTGTPIPGKPQCSDGFDNDADGKTDHPADPGCDNPNDTNEVDGAPNPSPSPSPTTPRTACADGLDNDGDGKVDFPKDPGCTSASDGSEADGGGGGGGGKRFVGSRVSIRHAFTPTHRFFGRVSSSLARCERGRRVIVRKVTPGSDQFISKDRTNRRGRWSDLHVAGGSGRYYAVVRPKSFTNNNGRQVVCERDTSRKINVTS